MAPTLTHILSRQNPFNGNGLGDFGRNGPGGRGGLSPWAIMGIVIAVGATAIISLLLLFFLLRRNRRRRAIIESVNLTSTTPYKPTSTPSPSDPTKYAGGAGGYTATADQNQSLLGNAEAPAITMWDSSTSDHAAAGSTQDGFGYDNNLQLAGEIQRPPSIAYFSAPPPRYEEATNITGPSGSLRPQSHGEAASYLNSAASTGEERGRSRSRDGSGEAARGRALSVDQRSINGDRRKSISKFREEGMFDVK